MCLFNTTAWEEKEEEEEEEEGKEGQEEGGRREEGVFVSYYLCPNVWGKRIGRRPGDLRSFTSDISEVK